MSFSENLCTLQSFDHLSFSVATGLHSLQYRTFFDSSFPCSIVGFRENLSRSFEAQRGLSYSRKLCGFFSTQKNVFSCTCIIFFNRSRIPTHISLENWSYCRIFRIEIDTLIFQFFTEISRLLTDK